MDAADHVRVAELLSEWRQSRDERERQHLEDSLRALIPGLAESDEYESLARLLALPNSGALADALRVEGGPAVPGLLAVAMDADDEGHATARRVLRTMWASDAIPALQAVLRETRDDAVAERAAALLRHHRRVRREANQPDPPSFWAVLNALPPGCVLPFAILPAAAVVVIGACLGMVLGQ